MKAIGYASGALTLLFMMGLFVYSTVKERPLPSGDAERFVIIAIVAFGAALASGFLGGDAAAKGSIPCKFATKSPGQLDRRRRGLRHSVRPRKLVIPGP